MTCRVEDIGLNPTYPLFTPAASPMNVRHCSKSRTCATDDLNWYRAADDGDIHPAALYSTGHAHLDIDRSRREEAFIGQRNRERTLLVADSSGYQIGSGVSDASDAFRRDIHGREADKRRRDILRWGETFGDYLMTIDFPTWAIGQPNYIFQTFDQCLRETVYNLDFIQEHRIPGRVKLLNVIQGNTYDQARRWYDSVKGYPFEGWSVAGPVAADPNITVKIILHMWRDGLINPDQRWVHVLGRSALAAVWNNNIIHRCLRDYVFADAQVSYDSSSAVQFAVNGTDIVGAAINCEQMTLEVADAQARRNDEADYARRMQTNLMVQIAALDRVNRLSERPVASLLDTRPVPDINIRFKEAVLRVFEDAAIIGIDRFPIEDVDLRAFSGMVQ